jgi:predicted secreted Zn-dependent protease
VTPRGAAGLLLPLAFAAGAQLESLPVEPPSRDVEVLATRIEYFPVRGLSIASLNASMRQTAPRDEDGKPVWGQAHWRLDWKFSHDTSSGCRVDKFNITVTSTLRMPEWVDRAKASAELQEKWAAFYRALLVHEAGHRDNGIRAANELARRIRGLGRLYECRTLNANIGTLGEQVIAEYNRADRAYDRGTEHGVRQGAVLR